MCERTSKTHAGELGAPADDCECEEKPAPEGAVVCGAADGREQCCHDSEANTVRDEHDGADALSPTSPRQQARAGRSVGTTWVAGTEGRVETGRSGQRLEQRYGIPWTTSSDMRSFDLARKMYLLDQLHYRRYNILSKRKCLAPQQKK